MPPSKSKQGLLAQLPFIKKWMKDHKGTEHEPKLQAIYDSLIDKSRTLTQNQIELIDKVVDKYKTLEYETKLANKQPTRRSMRGAAKAEEERQEKEEKSQTKSKSKIDTELVPSSAKKETASAPMPHKPFVDIKSEVESEDDDNLTEEEKQKKAEKGAKRLRELKKLQENIVKDAQPLPSRRSLKRVDFDEYDTSSSPYVFSKKQKTSESDENVQLVSSHRRSIKNARSESTADESSPKRPRIDASGNQKSTNESTKTQSDDSAAESTAENETQTRTVASPKSRSKKAMKSSGRTQTAQDAVNDHEMENIADTAPPTIKQEKLEPEEKISPIKISQLKENAAKNEALQQQRKVVRQTQIAPPEEPKDETETEFKIIENIAFARNLNAVTYECRIDGCNFQSHLKHTHAKHVSSHINASWSGFCFLCGKMVFRGGDCATVKHEIAHLHDHVMDSIIDRSSNSSNPNTLARSAKNDQRTVTALSKVPMNKIVIYPSQIMNNQTLKADLTRPASDIQKRDQQIGKEKPLSDSIDEVMRKISSRSFIPPAIRKISTSIIVPRSYVDEPAKNLKKRTKLIKKKEPTKETADVSKDVKQADLQNSNATTPKAEAKEPKSPVISPSSSNAIKPVATIKGIIGKKISLSSITGLKIFPQLKSPIVDPTKAATTVEEKTAAVEEKKELDASKIETAEKAETVSSDVKKSEEDIETDQSKFDKKEDVKSESAIAAKSTDENTTKPLSDYEREQLYHEALRPWLSKRTLKNFEQANKMKSLNGLSARFKCMASTCSFYTSNQQVFKQHLAYHEKFTPKDFENFRQCSYCTYEADFVEDLTDHIIDEHAFDRFHCGYCFYRSCHDFNVATHLDQFHKMKDKKIICSYTYDRRDPEIEYVEIEKNLPKYVTPIPCVYCRAEKAKSGPLPKFFIFRDFLLHLKEHTNVKIGKCAKCGGESTKDNLYRHLINCHGFGLFQCVHCRFGSNTFEIISNHLANEHPSKMAMFCERVVYKPSKHHNVPPPPKDSVRSIRLRSVTGYIEPAWKIRPEYAENNEEMKNQRLVGTLGPNIIVKPKLIQLPTKSLRPYLKARIPENAILIPHEDDTADADQKATKPCGSAQIARLLELPSTEPVKRSTTILQQGRPTTDIAKIQSKMNNVQTLNRDFVPKSQKEKIVYENVFNNRSPMLANLIRKKSALDIPEKPEDLDSADNVSFTLKLPAAPPAPVKSSGLMISDVYSLSNDDKKQL